MTLWMVGEFIPQGHAVLLLGQPHSVKSWFAEQLSICIATGMAFLGEYGFPVQKGSVILVDEDTPQDTLTERLDRLASAFGVSVSSIPLKIWSMRGFSLDSDSDINALTQEIYSMTPPVLVVLDSLGTMMGGWNENSTSDANKATKRWNELKATGATLLILHHMSLKKQGSYKEWDFTGKAMGNTRLIASCDTAFGMWRIPPEIPTRSVVKAKPRRTSLKAIGPFTVELHESKDKSWAQLTAMEELMEMPSEVAKAVFPLFYKDRQQDVSVQDIKDDVSRDYSEVEIREALHELVEQKALIKDREKKGKAHRYRYSLNPDFENQYHCTTYYWDELVDSL